MNGWWLSWEHTETENVNQDFDTEIWLVHIDLWLIWASLLAVSELMFTNVKQNMEVPPDLHIHAYLCMLVVLWNE